MEVIIVYALFLGCVVVIFAPVLDSGAGCGTLALMFLISTLIMVGLVALAFFIGFIILRMVPEMDWIAPIGGIAFLIIGIVLANRLMALFFD